MIDVKHACDGCSKTIYEDEVCCCEKCKEEAYNVGFDNGKEEGKKEGYDEGYAAAQKDYQPTM
ncbi:MAG: hypothetical protein KGI71_05990 [Patescibacteria group bacterium]|nr:hypothetical protein [Patescibacteria group bacterium]